MKLRLTPLLSAALLAPLASASAGLAGWWPLDGNVEDSGGDNDGAEQGAPVYETNVRAGLSGQSLRFAADTDGVLIPGTGTLDSAVFTLAYFINQDGAAQANAGLERLTSRGGDSFETAIGNANALGSPADGPSQLSYYSAASGWQRTGVVIPATGWVHVAWHNTAANMLLYVDGALVFTGPKAGAPAGDMSIGTRVNLGPVEGFEGLMDDVFLWDDSSAALTAADIAGIAATGLAPFLGDSDGDGLPDQWEKTYNLDPLDNGANPNNNGAAGNPVNGPGGDPDADGLTNLAELEKGTHPRNADTDGDGLKDGEEIPFGTDPKNPDTDNDGLNDKAEQTAGTDPLLPDTDGDGFLDSLEVAKGSNPKEFSSTPAPASTLVAHYSFDDTASDQSGFGNNGTLINDAVYSTDAPPSPAGGKSVVFGNSGPPENQGVNVPANPLLNSHFFTLAYWIRPASLQASQAGLERLTSRAGYAFETAIGDASAVGKTTAESGITLSYYDGAWHVTNVEIVPNEWTHAAWVSSETELTLYLNGEPAYTGSPLASTAPGEGAMRLGTSIQSNEGFEGGMDDFRLYAAALPAADIATIAGGTVAPPGSIGFTSLFRAPDGASVTLTWESKPGRTYALDYSTDLATWKSVNASIPSGGDTTQFAETVLAPQNRSRLFYRVREN